MRAVLYTRQGDASVLELGERPVPKPGECEIRVRVVVSGVNPTDWKSRSGAFGGGLRGETVPNHDGAGVVDDANDLLRHPRLLGWQVVRQGGNVDHLRVERLRKVR
jgi:NADPH:quinone reductase-like Zn-dependent oxidoreductase